jgi:hypothetical protein
MRVHQLLVWTVILIGASSNCDAAVGAAAYKGKDPIGGGPGYTKHADPAKAASVVSTLAELKAAFAKAQSGDVVYVRDGVEIDATGERDIVIPGGVTLAGNRGKNGASGPLIRANRLDLEPSEAEKAQLAKQSRGSLRWSLFLTGGPGARVTGLRIQGPDTTIRKEAYEAPNCGGILCSHCDLEVDNCEMWGWSLAAVHLSKAGQGARIHHCYLHHCRRMGLGYGVCLGESQALIECNRFAENRHDIAGTGRAGTSYLARYNISDANDPPISHAFDMHGNHESRPAGEKWPHFAGDSIVICYNTFKSCRPRIGIRIRGGPRVGVTVHDNVYENASCGASFDTPCKNAVIYGDSFLAQPKSAYYRFGDEGNNLNGKRMPAGDVTNLPR